MSFSFSFFFLIITDFNCVFCCESVFFRRLLSVVRKSGVFPATGTFN